MTAISSSQNDLESKYAHLLQPIRDLAKNWDIDLASELETYLSEVC
jgi:condensin-2 complex subunit H2